MADLNCRLSSFKAVIVVGVASHERWVDSMAQQWTSALPPSPKAQEVTACRLLDVNLIIVGCGPEAERLLQRRLKAGGRACLLWTDRPPQPLPIGVEPGEHDQILFDFATFRWQPPKLESTDCPQVLGLRRRYGSADYGFMRTGPDIVALAQNESYQFILQGQDLVGVRVLLGDALSWELSGAQGASFASSFYVSPVSCSRKHREGFFRVKPLREVHRIKYTEYYAGRVKCTEHSTQSIVYTE